MVKLCYIGDGPSDVTETVDNPTPSTDAILRRITIRHSDMQVIPHWPTTICTLLNANTVCIRKNWQNLNSCSCVERGPMFKIFGTHSQLILEMVSLCAYFYLFNLPLNSSRMTCLYVTLFENNGFLQHGRQFSLKVRCNKMDMILRRSDEQITNQITFWNHKSFDEKI